MGVKRSLRRPDALIGTWFGAGLAPTAPGTFGSAAALPPAAVIAVLAGDVGLGVAALILAGVGIWAAETYVRATGDSDPKEIVIDEVAGQFMPLIVVPFDWLPWLAAFLLFRLFDILKPWPCSYFDRSVHGGFGVMADDIAAGLYAAIGVLVLGYLGAW